MSYIKQLIQKYSNSAKRTVAGGLVALGVLTGSLTSCGNTTNNIIETEDTKAYTETVDSTKATESNTTNQSTETETHTDKVTDGAETDKTTETNQSTNKPTESETTAPKEEYLHSGTYDRAKQKWFSIWNSGETSRGSETGFLIKAAPFKFLEEQGVVYYNAEGEPRAYGTDDNFDNTKSIQSKAWIDPNTDANDFYLLTQYISAPIDEENYNDDTYVATYMLKYTLDDDCYRDLLLLSGDFRSNLLIQQIDQEYTPELISKSVIRYDLISTLDLFKDTPSGVNQSTMDYYKKDVCNYVSNIDYQNLTITVNYNNLNNKGDIRSYTYKLKESPYWDKVLQGSIVVDPIPQKDRDALTPEQIMPTYQSNAGIVLDDACAFNWTLLPSAEQKATASVMYDFDALKIDGLVPNDTVNKYEGGAISYSEVNNLTRDYISNLKAGLSR